jgi:hypothetical protein
MIQFKYETDLHKLDIDNPAYPVIENFIYRLIVTADTEQHPYNPDNDGFIILVEKGDIDRPLTEIWKDGDWGLSDIPFEGITRQGGFYVAVYVPNNQFGLVFIIPDEDWLTDEMHTLFENYF